MNNAANRPKARIRVCIEKQNAKTDDWTMHELSPDSPLDYTGDATDVGLALGKWITNILDCYPKDKLLIDITQHISE